MRVSLADAGGTISAGSTGSTGGDRELEAFAYAVIAHDGGHVPPSREYLRALVGGARERGLPEDYVAALGAIATSA